MIAPQFFAGVVAVAHAPSQKGMGVRRAEQRQRDLAAVRWPDRTTSTPRTTASAMPSGECIRSSVQTVIGNAVKRLRHAVQIVDRIVYAGQGQIGFAARNAGCAR